MKRMPSHTVGVDQGWLELFSDFQDGGDMWNGTGPRKVSRAIKFSEAFAAQPLGPRRPLYVGHGERQ